MSLSGIIKRLKASTLLQMNNESRGILPEDSFRQILERERERAMRNDHHFSLILFDVSSFIEDEDKISKLINSIDQRIRVVDEFGWYNSKRIGVILPYTPQKGADSVANYICKTIDFQIPRMGCEVYTYDREKKLDDNEINFSSKERA